jgi:isoleucyl-tRNA synthetase
LNPDAAYVIALANGEALVMAEELAGAVAADAGWEDVAFVTDAAGEKVTFPGNALNGATYKLPLAEGQGVIICGTHVTMDAGTGAVHTAPGHGVDDYKVCAANGIEEIKMPVDDDGRFYEGSCEWGGQDAVGSNEDIIKYLDNAGALIARKDITHSYPHCWRCHKPVIFRATTQWFVSMDKTGLRQSALNAINNEVRWVPEWAKNRIGAMVSERPDWCISRQRSWGVPIPVFKCKKCGATVANRESFDAVIELFETHGADAWFTMEPADYLPQSVKCEECGSSELAPESDILDVWWESGVSHTSVLKHRASEGLRFPADLYLEGSDQHRGWFQSSLLTSVGAYGVPPYKTVMHCGFTVDAEGRKMSKSLGNGVDPADVCSQFGADVLRLWVSSVDYSQDVSISDEILKRTSETYRRIRNTIRFILGSLEDFDDTTCAVASWDDLEPLDKWIYVRTLALVEAVTADYDEYRFHMVYRDIYDYIVNDLSAVYMDATKDRLYSEAPTSARRRAVQTVLYDILEVLVRVISPILSFTAEEAWQFYPPAIAAHEDRPESVQLAGWPTAESFAPAMPEGVREGIEADFAVLLGVRDAVTKALEDARVAGTIKKSQEADIIVSAPADVLEVVNKYDKAVFTEMLIVSSVAFEQAADDAEVEARATHTELPKCNRCWNYVERDPQGRYEDVCERCADVLDEIGFDTATGEVATKAE